MTAPNLQLGQVVTLRLVATYRGPGFTGYSDFHITDPGPVGAGHAVSLFEGTFWPEPDDMIPILNGRGQEVGRIRASVARLLKLGAAVDMIEGVAKEVRIHG